MADQERPRTDRTRNPPGSTPVEAPTTASHDRGTGEELREKAKEKAHEARGAAERSADRWTTSVGHRAESLSRALRAAEESLRSEGQDNMAEMAGEAASQVERMSGYLEDEDPSAMLHDMADLGRRNPGAFLGTAFTVGLAAGRFLRASEPADGDGQRRSTMPPPVQPSTVSPASAARR